MDRVALYEGASGSLVTCSLLSKEKLMGTRGRGERREESGEGGLGGEGSARTRRLLNLISVLGLEGGFCILAFPSAQSPSVPSQNQPS